MLNFDLKANFWGSTLFWAFWTADNEEAKLGGKFPPEWCRKGDRLDGSSIIMAKAEEYIWFYLFLSLKSPFHSDFGTQLWGLRSESHRGKKQTLRIQPIPFKDIDKNKILEANKGASVAKIQVFIHQLSFSSG